MIPPTIPAARIKCCRSHICEKCHGYGYAWEYVYNGKSATPKRVKGSNEDEVRIPRFRR
jgi:hypothetical protein